MKESSLRFPAGKPAREVRFPAGETPQTRAPTPNPSPEGEGGRGANPARGEVEVAGYVLRPTFSALVAAEAEVGALFALVERAAAGGLGLAETVALLWHCRVDGGRVDGGRVDDVARADFAEAVTAGGLAALAEPLGALLRQILSGRPSRRALDTPCGLLDPSSG